MKFSKILQVLSACVIATTLAGCGLNQFSAQNPSAASAGAGLSGSAHGGYFPVANATATLWYPGVTGYGSAPTALKSVPTDGNGAFSFPAASYTCPASDMPVYITITGGNPGLSTTGNWNSSSGNSYLALMSALGPCGSVASLTGLNVDEVTTIATVFATAQFSGAGQAANGLSAVNNLTITSGGTGYAANSVLAMSFSGGGCATEPTASVTVNSLGSVPLGTFNTSTPGAGCTSAPTVAASGGTGTGVVATAGFSDIGQSGSVGGLTIGSVGAATHAGGLAGNTATNGNNIGAPIGTVTGGILTVTNQLAYTDLKNAFNLVNNLVSINYGTVIPSNSNITVPSAKLNTMADIIADCVQTDGVTADSAICSNLSATGTGVTPSGHTAPTDTVQIADYMALAPFTNLTNVYNFATGQPVYSGTLTATPFDWTLPLVYSNLGIVQTSTTTGTAMAADASGNIWALGAGTGGYSMVGISPLGQSLNGGTAYLTGTSTPPISTVQAIMVDPGGAVWISNKSVTQNDLVRFDTTLLTASTYVENAQGSTGCGGSGLTMDSGLNILYTCALVTSPDFPLNGFQNTGTIAAPIYTSGSSQTFSNVPANTGTTTYPSVTQSDAAGNIWTPNYITTSCSVNEDLPNVNPQFGLPTSYTSQAIAPSAAGGSNPIGLTIDHNGVVWFACSTGFNHIPYGSAAGSTGVHVSGTGQINSAKYLAVDGAGDVWIANGTANAVTGTYAGSYYTLSEYSNSGANLTPCWETETNCQLNPPGGIALFASSTGYAYPLPVGISRYLTIDGSGNLWAANFAVNVGNVIEVVGGAVPVFTPLGAAAQQNRIGTLP